MSTSITLVFSQVVNDLPLHTFRQCVERYRGNHKVKEFTCLDQFLRMAFAQLTYRESLRDIEACLCAQKCRIVPRDSSNSRRPERGWKCVLTIRRPSDVAR